LPSVDGSSDDVYWVLTDIGWRIGGFWFCDDGLTVFWITVLGSGKTFVYVSFDDADRGSCVILSMLKIAAMVILASLVSVWFFLTLEVRSCFKKGVASISLLPPEGRRSEQTGHSSYWKAADRQ
jgi:hypothetical protein